MAIIKNEALMMGRGMVVVTRELGRELYPLVDDVLLMKVQRNTSLPNLKTGWEDTLLRSFPSLPTTHSFTN